ncbi:MAG: TetR/AcrR family transcriptional regulator [Pseudomonadota bacterium]
MSFMTEREKKIIEAAGEVFLRYGVKRTTMNDIAQEAGIARQTLYNAFANKDQVLRALIRNFNETAIEAITQSIETADGPSEKLDALFAHMILKPYDLLNSSPHAQDFLEGMNAAAREEIAATENEYLTLIENILTPQADAIERTGMTVPGLAELIYCSAKGAKYHTQSRAQLKRVLQSLQTTVLLLVSEDL